MTDIASKMSTELNKKYPVTVFDGRKYPFARVKDRSDESTSKVVIETASKWVSKDQEKYIYSLFKKYGLGKITKTAIAAVGAGFVYRASKPK